MSVANIKPRRSGPVGSKQTGIQSVAHQEVCVVSQAKKDQAISPLALRTYPRVSSDTPSAEALTAVAATVRFNVRAILSTPIFFLASPLSL
jgi:hypothetical protein